MHPESKAALPIYEFIFSIETFFYECGNEIGEEKRLPLGNRQYLISTERHTFYENMRAKLVAIKQEGAWPFFARINLIVEQFK